MKDAKGHGSNARGAAASARVAGLIQQAARHALTLGADHPKVGEALRAAAALEGQRLTGEAKVESIGRQHGIGGGPFRVQALDTKLAGTPWRTEKGYGNRTVAERTAQNMRIDRPNALVRVKVR